MCTCRFVCAYVCVCVSQAGRIEAELVKLSPDMESIEQWRVKDAEFRERAARLDEANKERDEVRVCVRVCVCLRAWPLRRARECMCAGHKRQRV